MKLLTTEQLKQVQGAAAAATPAPTDLGFFPKSGIAFLDKIHAWEYANIWGPLLGKIKKPA